MRSCSHDLNADMARIKGQIAAYAHKCGLDFFEVIFQLIDYDQVNQIAAYGGFPNRYPHWRFGMEYEKLRKRHSYGLGKIYEMVINNDPCYAYLMSSNDLVDQKLVMAHVYAHCDFFKNNIWFSRTNRKMMDEMANHATRIRNYADRFGIERVEQFIDVCQSLDNLIDPHSLFMKREPPPPDRSRRELSPDEQVQRLPAKGYMDRYINPPERIAKDKALIAQAQDDVHGVIPQQPRRDVLSFLLRRAPLQDWQQDVLDIVREEAYYFAPQAQTKIMNEGWATYWHSKIMTEFGLQSDEVIDYADHHSGTLATSPGQLNPYKLGVELYRDIEERWDRGQFGSDYEQCDDLDQRRTWNTGHNRGREKIFEVRRIYNDVGFIDSFLTPEFVDKYKLYHYQYDQATHSYRIVNRDFDQIKSTMLFSLTNAGQPFIYVVDGNYGNRGELFLAHQHMEVDLEIRMLNEALKNMHAIWTRPVHIQAKFEDDMVLFSYDGDELKQQKITDELPKPAHQIA